MQVPQGEGKWRRRAIIPFPAPAGRARGMLFLVRAACDDRHAPRRRTTLTHNPRPYFPSKCPSKVTARITTSRLSEMEKLPTILELSKGK
jgi:hypothetical protein